jgi:hypothetical protein
MSARHLSCEGCRVRFRASAPEIDLLQGECPICGAKLRAVPFPSGVVGFRSLDLNALSEQPSSAEVESSKRPHALEPPVDLVARRNAALARDAGGVERRSDKGGAVSAAAAADLPAAL